MRSNFNKIIIIISVFLLFGNLAAQNQIDSLKTVLHSRTTGDTTRVRILFELSEKLSRISPNEAENYAAQSFSLAKKINDKIGIARGYFLFTVISFHNSSYENSLSFADTTLMLCAENGDDKYVNAAIMIQGIIHLRLGDLIKARELFLEGLDNYRNVNHLKGQQNALINLGAVYSTLGIYDIALEYYFDAMKLNDKIGDERNKAAILNNIAIINQNVGKFSEANEYLQKALVINKKYLDKISITSTLNNIGNNYYSLVNYDSALTYFRKALAMAEEINNSYEISKSCSYIGIIYSYLKRYSSAENYLTRSLKIQLENNDVGLLSETYRNLGENYLRQGNFAFAEIYFDSSLVYAFRNDNKFELMLTYLSIYKLNKEIKNYKKALEYYEQYSTLKDSIIDKKKIEELRAQYDVESRDKEIEILKKNNEIQEFETARQKLIIQLSIGSFILVMLLVALLYNRYRTRIRLNKEITNKNEQLEILAKQLTAQTEQLKELAEVKSHFFSNISHELRTPLTLVIGPLEQLINNTDDNELKDQYKLMLRNAHLQLNLVNQLLDLSKIEKGKMKLSASKNNLNDFLKIMVSSFDSLAHQKEISLLYNVYECDSEIYFDSQKLQTIMNNLILNALKFTDAGGRVEIKTDTTDGFAVIKILDNGIGIPPVEREHIFEHFYQAENWKGKNYGGTGLGLAITKELVELHHGKIEVESEPNNGTVFTIYLPLGKNHLRDEEIIDEPTELKILPPALFENHFEESKIRIKPESSYRVLIVEDNQDMKSYICKNLSKEYKTIDAENGLDGFQKAKKHLPDLIISDIMMPFMDGFELTAKLKQDTLTSHIPVILLTARAGEESKINGLNIGADDYINKPFSMNELNARIRNLIKSRQQLREKFQKHLEINLAEVAPNSLDEDFLKKVVAIIEQNISDPDFGVEELCGKVAMSQSNLFRKIKALTDLSVTQFIRNIRLKKAAQILKNKTANVSDTMYQVGFNSISYFAKCFKEQFGVLPSEFE